jgi:hypothetical protein
MHPFNVVKQALCSTVSRPKYRALALSAEVPLGTLYLLWYFPTKESLVKSERRKRYPDNWDDLSWQCKERAGWKCAFCHITQGKKRKSKRTGKLYIVYLHAAHRDHDLGNPNPVLLCLCPTCHGKYDYRYRIRKQYVALERLKHKQLLPAL